jgi:hypothetical protein
VTKSSPDWTRVSALEHSLAPPLPSTRSLPHACRPSLSASFLTGSRCRRRREVAWQLLPPCPPAEERLRAVAIGASRRRDPRDLSSIGLTSRNGGPREARYLRRWAASANTVDCRPEMPRKRRDALAAPASAKQMTIGRHLRRHRKRWAKVGEFSPPGRVWICGGGVVGFFGGEAHTAA